MRTSAEENKAIVRRFHDEFNKGNLVGAAALFAPDITMYHASPEPLRGQAIMQLAATFQAAFPDGQNTIEQLIADGDSVAARGTYRATHLGEFQGIPATGRHIEMQWMSIDRFADGKIAESRVEQDTLGLLQQLGAIPAPGQTAGEPTLAHR